MMVFNLNELLGPVMSINKNNQTMPTFRNRIQNKIYSTLIPEFCGCSAYVDVMIAFGIIDKSSSKTDTKYIKLINRLIDW